MIQTIPATITIETEHAHAALTVQLPPADAPEGIRKAITIECGRAIGAALLKAAETEFHVTTGHHEPA